MTHGMFGAMDETSDDRRRQLRATDTAEVAKCCDIEGRQLRNRRINPFGQSVEHSRHVRGSKRAAFRRYRRELLSRQRLAAGVGEQPVDHSGHMSHVECRRRHTGRAAVPLLFGQPRNQLTDALAYLEKDVGDWLKDSGNTLDGTTLPPLGVCHSHAISHSLQSGSGVQSASKLTFLTRRPVADRRGFLEGGDSVFHRE